MWEINVVLSIFKEFVLVIGLGGVVIFLLWKIMTNHLSHIASDIKDIAIDVKSTRTDVEGIKGDMALDRERIATLEGKCSAKCPSKG